MTDTTGKITSWPPNVAEWQTVSGRSIRLDGDEVLLDLPDYGDWWLLFVPGESCFANIWNETDNDILERVEGMSNKDAAIAGFNRLIELGIIKRRSTVSVDSSVDCDGPVDDSPTFTDNLE